MEEERWRDAVGYESYLKVSDHGQVWRKRTKKLASQFKTEKGYLIVELCLKNGLGRKRIKVHRLVAQAFIDNPNDKPQVNHLDGNKTNNHYLNLEWCTAQENARHAMENGLGLKGEQIGTSKLKESDIVFIRDNHKRRCPKYGSEALARTFGVSGTMIRDIVKNKAWKHVK